MLVQAPGAGAGGLLGHGKTAASAAASAATMPEMATVARATGRPWQLSSGPCGGTAATPQAAGESPPAAKPSTVRAFLSDHLFPADGGRLDIKAMVLSYREWCADKNLQPAPLDAILDEIEQLCGKLGVRIEPDEQAQRVYVYGVKIEAPMPVQA